MEEESEKLNGSFTEKFLPVIIISHDDKAGLNAKYWGKLLKCILKVNLRILGGMGFGKVLVYGTTQSGNLIDFQQMPAGMQIDTMKESIAEGNAGFLREVIKQYDREYYLVCQQGILLQKDISDIFRSVYEEKAALSVLMDDDLKHPGNYSASGVYVCSRQVGENITPAGYYDLKENLIPDLLFHDQKVISLKNNGYALNVNHWQSFLNHLPEIIHQQCQADYITKNEKDSLHFIHSSARMASSARLAGPVMICEQAIVGENVFVAGPVVIGGNTVIGDNTLITESIVGESSQIQGNCFIEKSMIDSNNTIMSGAQVHNQVVRKSPQATGWWDMFVRLFQRQETADKPKITAIPLETRKAGPLGTNNTLIFNLILIAVLIWSYWPTVSSLWSTWMQTDEYSSGLLVPFMAVYVLWMRREEFGKFAFKASITGVFVFIIAQLIRSYGFLANFNSLLNYSLWLSLLGLTLWMYGWRITWKSATVFLFVLLAFPLPKLIENRITLPLQSFATDSAVFLLELFNYNVLQEGNVLHLGDTVVAVAEACNGLRMITAFFVINALVAFLINRPLWTKTVVVLSSLPIAIFCNTIRLFLTAIAFKYITGEQWQTLFHDFGGYAMMPLALLIVIGELWLIDKLWQPASETEEKASEQLLIIKNQ